MLDISVNSAKHSSPDLLLFIVTNGNLQQIFRTISLHDNCQTLVVTLQTCNFLWSLVIFNTE